MWGSEATYPHLQQSNVAVPFMTQGQGYEVDQICNVLNFERIPPPPKSLSDCMEGCVANF